MLEHKMIYREREDENNLQASFLTFTNLSSQRPPVKDDTELSRAVYGSWDKGGGFKEDGMMKKVCVYSFAILHPT